MQRLIIVGSPRSGGRCAHLADALMEACIEECPEDGLTVLSIGAFDVDGCIGCDGCRPVEVVEEGPIELAPGETVAASRAGDAADDAADYIVDEAAGDIVDDAADDVPDDATDDIPDDSDLLDIPDAPDDALPCVINDDMAIVRAHLNACDELIFVTPVYFSGVPSQLKAWLDRLQPFFWTDRRHGPLRPATIHIVGEGADPFGFSGVLASVSSSILCAGFQLVRALSWVGRIDEDGEILEDAEELDLEGSVAS